MDKHILKLSYLLAAIPFIAIPASDPFNPFQIDDADMKLVTPSLLSVSSSESPVSITKLHSDDLKLLGIDNIVDALRLVPGMLIADEFGSGSVVGYHGTNVNIPRRMEVLFNGHSIYRPGYAGLNWQRLPLDITDLSSIEIIRGGSVVDFGSNAFQATVNLIQTPLATLPRAKVEGTYSENTERFWAGAQYAFEDGQVFARFFQENGSGYDVSGSGKDIKDDFTGKNILVSGIVNVGENTLLDFTFMSKRYDYSYPGFLGVDLQSTLAVANGSLTQVSRIEDRSDNIVIKLSATDHLADMPVDWTVSSNFIHVKRNQPIHSCQPAYVFDPLLAKIDNSPNIHLMASDFQLLFESGFEGGNAQIKDSIVNPLDENDFDLLLQLGQRMQAVGIGPIYEVICGRTDTNVEESRYSLNSRVKLNVSKNTLLSTALEVRRDTAKSKTYLNGEVDSDSYSLSSSIQYALSENDLFNAGVMVEDNDRTGSALSYRVSYIRQISQEQSLRLTYSDSKRSPDMYETERFWRFFYTFDAGFVDYQGQREAYYFRTSTSPDDLKAETNRTIEVGYQLSGELNKYQLDAKIFQENYLNMISEPFDFFNFNLTNNGENKLRGLEFGGHYQFEFAKVGSSYLYLDSETDTRFEGSLFSRHSGSVWTIIPVTDAHYLGGTVTGNSGIGGTEHIRFDATLSYKKVLFDKDIFGQLILRHYPGEFRTFTEFSDTSPNVVKFDNRNQILFNLSISF
ncbi:MAG: iron complex outermembrane receptor protein [Congregibacter sp.]|jgi:iron complex outermembrane receptor protein